MIRGAAAYDHLSRKRSTCRVDGPPDFHPTQPFLISLLWLKQDEQILISRHRVQRGNAQERVLRADFSFDRICLIPSICRHQSSIQDLLAFLQPFNVLPYGAIHKVAPRIRGNVRFKPILFPNQACCTLEAVLSHTPNSAPVRRFSFAGEQQDSDTAIRIVRPIFIEPEMPRGSGSAQFEIHRSSQGNKTCGRLSACQKNEQKPIKRSGKQTDWKIRNLAVPRRIAKKKPTREDFSPAALGRSGS